MYQYMLMLFLYSSLLNAAESEYIKIPRTLDEIPEYCAEFSVRSLEQQMESDLLAEVDSWEDNLTLLGAWDDGILQCLFKNVYSVFGKARQANNFSALGKSEMRDLCATAIKEVQSGWKAASVEEYPGGTLKRPDECVLFINENKQVVPHADFVQFLVDRLGMEREAKCRTCVKKTEKWPRDRKTYLLIKKENLTRFQDLLHFDLGDD